MTTIPYDQPRRRHLASWLPFCGRPAAPTTVLDPDVSAPVSGAADKFLRVHADPEHILHLDFQSGHDSAQLPPRLRLYIVQSRTGATTCRFAASL